jgi:hypothetical protein
MEGLRMASPEKPDDSEKSRREPRGSVSSQEAHLPEQELPYERKPRQ